MHLASRGRGGQPQGLQFSIRLDLRKTYCSFVLKSYVLMFALLLFCWSELRNLLKIEVPGTPALARNFF